MNKIYLDYSATSPVDKRVIVAMKPYFSDSFGNASSIHKLGQDAKVALEETRSKIASLINCFASELIFTSSATESNNTVLFGVKSGHIIISGIEHPSISEPTKELERRGIEVTRIKPNKEGIINPNDVNNNIKSNTVLVSIIHGSNEIGTIQDISKIGSICRRKKVLFHTDASASLGKIPIDTAKMKIDLLTASSHKIYGPKGIAALYMREGVKINPLIYGGGQEEGLRSSTVNIPLAVGFGKACEIIADNIFTESKRLTQLRDKVISSVLEIKEAHLTGHKTKRLSNHASFWFNDIEGEVLVMELSKRGIYTATGSACASFKIEPSEVLLSIGLNNKEARGSLRVSLGKDTKESDILYFLKVLPKIVSDLRQS